MIINRTNKLKPDGFYWHEQRIVNIQRIYGGMAFKGFRKFLVVLAEEDFMGDTHYFILAEAETEIGESLIDLFSVARILAGSYQIKRWFGRLDDNVREVLAIHNKMQYNYGLKNLTIGDVPRTGELIDENVALVRSLTTKEDKRLHFFNESTTVSELKALPERDIRAEDYPRASALSFVVGGMLKYSHDNISPADLIPEPEGDY